jgi:replicative DNA helicase
MTTTTPKDELRDPHAEREVLAWVFERDRSPAEVKAMLSAVPKQSWAFDRHRHMADAMLGLAEIGVPVDVLSLRTALVERGHWETCGGVNGLGALLGIAGATENVPRCAKRIVQLDIERQILDEWTGGMVESMQPKPRHVERLGRIAELNAKLVALDAPQVSWVDKVRRYGDTVRNPKQRVVYPTGITRLDEALNGGWCAGWSVTVLGPAKKGKTALVSGNFVARMLRDGHPVIEFSEMSLDEKLARWLAAESNVPLRAQARGDLTGLQHGAFTNAEDRVASWICDVQPLASFAAMADQARAFKRLHGRIGAFVVDHLQATTQVGDDRVSHLETVTRGVKNLAQELGCVGFLLSQPDKGAAVGGEIGLHSGKGTGSIASDCDVMLIPVRDKKDPRRAGISCPGFRHGAEFELPLGELRFNGARMVFEEA